MLNISDSTHTCSLGVNASCWATEANRLNREYAELMVPVEVFMVILMVVGIFGNALVLIVYINRQNRTTAHIFIMYLAAIDLMGCTIIHPYIIYKLFNNYTQTWTVACKIFEFILHANLTISALTLLAVAIDRFLAICRPVKFLTFHTHIYKIILVTFILGILVSLPLLEFYGSKAEQLPEEEQLFMDKVVLIVYKCDYRHVYQGSVTMTAFSAFMMSGFLLQFVAMAVLYKCVAVAAYRSRRVIVPVTRLTASTSMNAEHVLNASSSPVINSSLPPTGSTGIPAKLEEPTGNNIGTGAIASPKCLLATERHESFVFTRNAMSSNTKTRKAYQRNNDLHSSKKFSSSLKAAKILFLVTAVFFLSWMPFFILRIIYTIDKSFWKNTSDTRRVIEHLLNHCIYINNAINPVIYSVINKNFRQDCFTLVKRECKCK